MKIILIYKVIYIISLYEVCYTVFMGFCFSERLVSVNA